jgi:hypothetical protein
LPLKIAVFTGSVGPPSGLKAVFALHVFGDFEAAQRLDLPLRRASPQHIGSPADPFRPEPAQEHTHHRGTEPRLRHRCHGNDLGRDSTRPSWLLYKSLLSFVSTVRADINDLAPRDMIDMQSFLWVQGSEEYSG